MRRDKAIIQSLKARSATAPRKSEVLQSVPEWRELLLDLIYDNEWSDRDEGLVIYLISERMTNSRGEGGAISGAVDFFNSLGYRSRNRVCRALESIAAECLREPSEENQKVLSGVLKIEWFLEGAVRGQMLRDIMLNRELAPQLRSDAGASLIRASFPNAVPLSFWQSLNVTADPPLVLAVFQALVEKDLAGDAFDALKRVQENPGLDICQLRFRLVEVVEDYQRSVNGVSIMVSELLPGLPQWAVEPMRDAIHMATNGTRKAKDKLIRALE